MRGYGGTESDCNRTCSSIARLLGAAVRRYRGRLRQDSFLIGRKRSECDRLLKIETCSLICLIGRSEDKQDFLFGWDLIRARSRQDSFFD